MAFASGKYALAICDRCGFRYKYTEIKEEWNGSRVCPECFETKHPQLESPKVRADAEALRNARPDVTETPVSAADLAAYQDLVDNN
jgi:PHP family Zn ribbon phosphoesterase